MSAVSSPEELFKHELQDLYYAEKTLEKALPQLAREAEDSELSRAFESHLKETRGQIDNLEQVFRQLGETPKAQPCPGIDGIKEEHDEFVAENERGMLLDVFLTGAASRAEHYEIAAYTGLVAKAKALGERDSAALLRENLEQEKEALKTVETISKRLLKSVSANGKSSNGRKRQSRAQSRKATKS